MAQSTRELNVNINVDITETIRGLKAIQREAKKAAQALRELEAVQSNPRNFEVGAVIECGGPRNTFRCICADNETAVFASTSRTEDGWHTEYNEMWAWPNAPELRDSIADNYRIVEAAQNVFMEYTHDGRKFRGTDLGNGFVSIKEVSDSGRV